MSQEAVGCRAGRDAATISRIERGLVQPNASTMIRLARALDISVGRLRRLLSEGRQHEHSEMGA
jgi:transcriptional regulator with XRE-family HTH domain